MLPTLTAVDEIGGTPRRARIKAEVISNLEIGADVLADTTKRGTASKFEVKVDFAISRLAAGGLLDPASAGEYRPTQRGREVLGMSEELATEECNRVWDRVMKAIRARRSAQSAKSPLHGAGGTLDAPGSDTDDSDLEDSAPPALLPFLHSMPWEAFERLVPDLLREYGMDVERTGKRGKADGGIDAVGTARLSDIFSCKVAIQCKQYIPSAKVERRHVSALRDDGRKVGAERLILITTGQFSDDVHKEAQSAIPNVELIDGQRLCRLMLTKSWGAQINAAGEVEIDEAFFERYW